VMMIMVVTMSRREGEEVDEQVDPCCLSRTSRGWIGLGLKGRGGKRWRKRLKGG
jgi:hypothetical protein